MRKVTRRRKYKKRVTKKNKTRRTKTVRRINRRKLCGGTNHLGEVFLEIIKNKKIYEEEGMKHDAQSRQYEDAGMNIEELTEELKTAINDDVKFKRVMELLDDYEYLKNMNDQEVEANNSREKKDSQGEYWAQNEYATFLVELRDEYGIELDL
jgi:hypothetical protein